MALKGSYPQYPVFDEFSTGVVFDSVSMATKKLGLNFCLNRPTSLYYIKEPKFKKEEVKELAQADYVACLNPGEYVGMQARFSHDYSRLCYVASENKFLSHSGNYQLKYLAWPIKEGEQPAPVTVLDYISEYPEDDGVFSGLYGYNLTYT